MPIDNTAEICQALLEDWKGYTYQHSLGFIKLA
jgi:hypothetical protein